jgi:integrase
MRERPPGSKRWELRAYAGRDQANGKPRQVSRIFRGGKREANRALALLVTEIDQGKHVGTAANVTTLISEYLRHVKRTKDIETYESYRMKLEKTVEPELGPIKLAKLTAHDLDTLYAKLAELRDAKGNPVYASTTIEHTHNVISGALTQAGKWGWLDKNVAKLASPPRAVPKERQPLSPEEIHRLIQGALELDKDPDIATMIYLLCLVGGRRGEACGFQWGDIDWEQQIIHVNRQLVPSVGGQREKPPKGGKKRAEAIGAIGVRILMAYQGTQRKRFGEHWTPQPSAWLISPDGGATPMRAKNVTMYIGRLGAKLDPSIEARPHDFRRFSVTQLGIAGVDPRAIRDRHGHASIVTTERYMLRVAASDIEAADIMGELLTSAGALLMPSDDVTG